MISGWSWFWIALAALVLSAFFGTLQLSLREAARRVLAELAAARADVAGAKRLNLILDDLDGHAIAVALPRIICNLAVAVAAVAWLTDLRGGEGPAWVEMALGLLGAAALLWFFGVAVPLSLAEHAGERVIYTWSGLIRGTYLVLRPLRAVTGVLDEGIRRLTGARRRTEEEIREAELLSVVEEGEREGHFDEAERDMIEAVVEFRNRTVEQVMTPRIDVEAMELTNDLGRVISMIRESNHSRIPVYEESLDHIVGIFYVKDLMRWLAGDGGARQQGKPFNLREILRPALYVPETKTVRELLEELLSTRVHIAIVADEYGGTAGIVTMEDIVEEIFGDIQDEYERPEDEPPDVVIAPDRASAEVDARARIGDVNDELDDLGIVLPESEDYDTVGGFVMTTLGRIPAAGEHVRHGRTIVTVLEAEPTRVVRVRMELAPEPAPPSEAAEENGVRTLVAETAAERTRP